MERYPDVDFCQQMLSSNELENIFSLTMGQAGQGGYHAGAEQMARLLETVCRKQEIIRNPDVGVSVPVSNSRPYPQRMKQRHGDWNNGDLLGDAPEHVAKRLKVDEGVEREAIRKMRNRLAPRERAKAKKGGGIRV